MDDMRPEAHAEDAAAVLAAAMPGTPAELAQRLLLEAAEPLGLSGDPAHEEDDAAKVAAALQMVQAAAPRDALEAMLAAQMAAGHIAAMRAMRQAAQCADYPQIAALHTRQAARLMTLFLRQTEALERRRARDAVTRSVAHADMARAVEETVAAEARQTAEDRASSPSPTPPPVKGEGLYLREPDDLALPLDGGGLGGGGTRQSRAAQHKRNGHRRPVNGAGPPPFAS